MPRPRIVLRPEPGNAATASAIEAEGGIAIRMPLFQVVPCEWQPVDPARFDALVLTSANAVRHAGPALGRYAGLPVHAVGPATAAAAREAGLLVAAVGEGGAAALLDDAAAGGVARALRLGGRHQAAATHPVVAHSIAVYHSIALPLTAPVPPGSIALVHSPRAGAQLARLVPPALRSRIALAAISPTALEAADSGWEAVAVAARPDDATLRAAARLIDRDLPPGDKAS